MPFSDLPHELLLEIFSYWPRYDFFHTPPLVCATDHFGNSELHRFSQVCRAWRFAIFEHIYETLPVGIMPFWSSWHDPTAYHKTVLAFYHPIKENRSFQHTPFVRSLYIHMEVFDSPDNRKETMLDLVAVVRNCINLRKITISAGNVEMMTNKVVDLLTNILSILCAALAELPLLHLEDLEFSLFEANGETHYHPIPELRAEAVPKGITNLLERVAPRLKRFHTDIIIPTPAMCSMLSIAADSKALRHLGWRFINDEGATQLSVLLENLLFLTTIDLCQADCSLQHWHKLLKKITALNLRLESLAIGARADADNFSTDHPRASESVVTSLCKRLGKKLRKLDVSGNRHLGDKWWHALLDSCPNLEVLNMAQTRVIERELQKISQIRPTSVKTTSKPRFPHLRFINLYSWAGRNEALLERIRHEAPKARYLWTPCIDEYAPRYRGEFIVNTFNASIEFTPEQFLLGWTDGFSDEVEQFMPIEVGFTPWQIKAIIADIDAPHRLEIPNNVYREEQESVLDEGWRAFRYELRTHDLHLVNTENFRIPQDGDWASNIDWEALGLWYPFKFLGEGNRQYGKDYDDPTMSPDYYDALMETDDDGWGHPWHDMEGDLDLDSDMDEFEDDHGDGGEWQTTDEEAE